MDDNLDLDVEIPIEMSAGVESKPAERVEVAPFIAEEIPLIADADVPVVAPSVIGVRNLMVIAPGVIDCEVKHATFGWMPFAAHISDKEEASLFVFNYIIANNIEISKLPVSPKVAAVVVEFERSWRDGELLVAGIELLKAEDEDPTSVGTPTDWRKYRVALRSWPDSPLFPDATKRPKRPT